PRVERRALQRLAPRGDRRGDAILQPIDQRALLFALLGRHGAERLQQCRYRTTFPERRNAHGLERGFILCASDGAADLLLECGDVAHRVIPAAPAGPSNAACRPPASAANAPVRDVASDGW